MGDQETGSPGKPVSCGLQVHGEPGALSYKNKTPLVTFLSYNYLLPSASTHVTSNIQGVHCK